MITNFVNLDHNNPEELKNDSDNHHFDKINELNNQINNLTIKLEKTAIELEEYKDKFLRSTADKINSINLIKRDSESSIKFSNKTLIKEIVDIYTNMSLAIDHSNLLIDELDSLDEIKVTNLNLLKSKITTVLKGYQLIFSYLHKVLMNNSVEIIAPNHNDIFNPEIHEVLEIKSILASDNHLNLVNNSICKVLQKGYKLHNQVIKPATVSINQIKD